MNWRANKLPLRLRVFALKTSRRMKNNLPSPAADASRGGPAAEVAQFTESISFDWRLWRHDILGSMAHATMLQKIGVLTKKELRAIIRGLDAHRPGNPPPANSSGSPSSKTST